MNTTHHTSPRIAILDTGYDSYQYEQELFEKHGYILDIFPGESGDKKAFARDAVGLLIRWTIIDDEFLNALPNLKAIVRYGVGYENIDLKAASAHGVKVANVQGYANHAVSDHAIALMYACARAIKSGGEKFHSNFGKAPTPRIFEFHDRTLGIIGLGRIGGTLCHKAKHLFKRVLAADPYIPDQRFIELGAIKSDLKTLLNESHVISLHCNLTDETRHLINHDAFRMMAQKPILINTARGDVIDEEALKFALDANLIHSAGIDVFHDEPPGNNLIPILNRPNVIATGHYAWYSETAMLELQKRAADNLLMLLQGQIPADCLNP